jgi:hypothetical protein
VDFQRLKGANPPQVVEDFMNRINDAANANGGVVPADVFKTIRSDIGRTLRASSDPETIQALRGFQDSLFNSLERTAPAVAEDWRAVNDQYRHYKTLEKAMGGAGIDTAEGQVTPGKLRNASQKAAVEGAYQRGNAPYADISRAGQVMTPLPNSGTAGRTIPTMLSALAGGTLATGELKPLLAAAAGAALPAGISSLLTSGPVRRALIRQLTGRGGAMLDPTTAALLARQLDQSGGREQ